MDHQLFQDFVRIKLLNQEKLRFLFMTKMFGDLWFKVLQYYLPR